MKTRLLWTPLVAGLMALAAPSPASAQVSLTTVVELAQQNSAAVRLAQADVRKAAAQFAESRDVFLPSLSFGSGLPAFPEVGFTGSLPTIWDASVQSLVFSLSQVRYAQAARSGLRAAQLALQDARDQVALDASTAYIEMDTIDRELEIAGQQQQAAARLVEIEEQRTAAGVDPLMDLLQAKLTAAQLRLNYLHLQTRAATLAKQLATLTGLPAGSITPDHASIPEVPAVKAGEVPEPTRAIRAAQMLAISKAQLAKGDQNRAWSPQFSFGIQYNRNTTLLNDINSYYARPLPANNLSSGFSIQVPLFDAGLRAKSRESAADALRARAEAEQARRQNEVQIAELTGTLRELDALAEVASLKQQVAAEQLKSVLSQLELGNGAGTAAGAPPQLSPRAEQEARIAERQKYEDALDAGFELSKARLGLLRALGHMQDWLNELHSR
jgi:outer membrane protein TolC